MPQSVKRRPRQDWDDIGGEERMEPLRRAFELMDALDSAGLTGMSYREMEDRLGKSRKTIERMLPVLKAHFDIEEKTVDRQKRFWVGSEPKWGYRRPSAEEIAALDSEVQGLFRNGDHARAAPLHKLLTKLRFMFDDVERVTTHPKFVRLAQSHGIASAPGTTSAGLFPYEAAIKHALLNQRWVRCSYKTAKAQQPKDYRLVPYALVSGSDGRYLVAAETMRPDARIKEFRLDRMLGLEVDDKDGARPKDWNLDEWLAQSSGSYHGPELLPVRLETLPVANERARSFQFHPKQRREEREDGSFLFEFEDSSWRELAWEIFKWRGEVIVHEPQELKDELRKNLELVSLSLT